LDLEESGKDLRKIYRTKGEEAQQASPADAERLHSLMISPQYMNYRQDSERASILAKLRTNADANGQRMALNGDMIDESVIEYNLTDFREKLAQFRKTDQF